MKIRKTSLKEISSFNTLLILNKLRDQSIEKKLTNRQRFINLSCKISSGAGLKYDSFGDMPYISGEDIDEDGFITLHKYIDDPPFILPKNTLITGRVGTVGKFAVLKQQAVCSDNIIYIILKNESFATYIKWFMMSPYGSYQINLITKGKNQPVINKTNLSRIKIIIPQDIEEITEKLIDYEQQIITLRNKLISPEIVIQEILIETLNIPYEDFEKINKKKVFKTMAVNISASFDLRISISSLHPKNIVLLRFLKKYNTKFLRELLTEPIKRGVQPKYNNYGDIPVIKTKNLQNYNINMDEIEYVDNRFYKQNRLKAGIMKGDILLSSTGEGRGKIDLYNFEQVALADTHISIIRVKNINRKYLTYYFRSILGNWQLYKIERHVKGTPEIYAKYLNNFIIIMIPEDDQIKIVKKIEEKFHAQDKILKDINNIREKIFHIFRNLI